MSDVTHRQLDVNGVSLHVAECGSGFPVLFSHGFPELWYSWRHQMTALAQAGYRAIAPDQRGYGDSSAPQEIRAYSMHHLVGDMVGILDALGLERAVVVGHDWGGAVAWQTALMAPHRVAGVVGVNTPHFPRMPIKPTDVMRAMSQGHFHYILYFQEPGVAEAELDADPARTLRGFFQSPDRARLEALLAQGPAALGPQSGGLLDRLPDAPHGAFLTSEDFAVYEAAYRRTGFRGGINWYRNFDYNWETTAYQSGARVAAPALMITADLDPVLRPELAAGMAQWVPQLRRTVLVSDCGHWTQQEKPAAVNAALLEFLVELA
ncbi:MAG: alpha/beta hydrolase [Deltaproteobacteria bacterium]|nr:alpha/beta hydrolase [Deltaproteobacteria bacterium]